MLHPVNMASPDTNWSAGIFQRLDFLSKDRQDSDVKLWVGDRHIPAHRFVLYANSDIMRADEVYFKDTERMYHVILSEEFGENFELLSELITSLYDGLIKFKEDDVKFVYKFAKIYNIDWLKRKAFHLFECMLSRFTFIEIFQFAHSVSFEDLKEMCVDYLTPKVLDSLIKGGELLNIDYHCLCTIISVSHSSVLPEMEKFQLVCKWLETDVSKRICHLESLISLTRFNILEKSDLVLVFEWLLNNKNINDSCRIKSLQEIKIKSNAPIPQMRDITRRHQSLKSSQKTLETIKAIISQNDHNSSDVSFSDFCLVIENHYSNGDPVTRHNLAEFLTKQFGKLIT